MKIGLVFDDSLDKTDGVAQYVLALGAWLHSQGHEVHYLVGETVRTDLANLHSLSRNIKVNFNQNQLRTPLPVRRRALNRALSGKDFDILHIQMPYSPFMAARVVKIASDKTAIVGTFHIAPASKFVNAGTKGLGFWLRRNLRRFSAFISVSPPAQAFAQKTFGIASEVIPNTVRLDNFFGAKPLTPYKNIRTVVFLGRLVERKGCQYLLAAVAQLHRTKKWPADAKVLICGDGPLRMRLLEFVHQAGLTEIVEFKGFVTEAEKPRYMASADVAVFPSTGGESFGIVLLEAMAAARGIVLAGDNPGYASVMREHPESLLVPQDTDAFAALLLASLENTTIRAKATAWQKRYARNFEPGVVGGKILKVYERALAQRPLL